MERGRDGERWREEEMGREGEGREVEMKRRGRRGGAMRKGRRGLIVGGMILGLLFGCNNGGESAEGNLDKTMIEIGKSTEKLFYSFINLASSALGLNVAGTTTREHVKAYYDEISKSIEIIKKDLEEVAKKAMSNIEQETKPEEKEISSAFDNANETLNSLKEHVDALKDIGDTDPVGNANTNGEGTTVDVPSLKKATDALKGIVVLAKKSKAITELKKLDKEVSTVSGSTPENGIKILGKIPHHQMMKEKQQLYYLKSMDKKY